MAALMPGEITRKRDSDYHYHVRTTDLCVEVSCTLLSLESGD